MQHPLPTRCPWEGTQGWLPRGQSPRDGNAQGWKQFPSDKGAVALKTAQRAAQL